VVAKTDLGRRRGLTDRGDGEHDQRSERRTRGAPQANARLADQIFELPQVTLLSWLNLTLCPATSNGPTG
jgi:hypothetical protein